MGDMETSSNTKDQRVLLALAAGGLFALAGLIEIVVGYVRIFSATTPHDSLHGTGMLSVGGMFTAVGGLWIVIGAKWKAASKESV